MIISNYRWWKKGKLAMHVFISWSKKESCQYAKETKAMIEKLKPSATVFMSESDIMPGQIVQDTIVRNIQQCDILIICFTRTNKKSPWLLYEAGYARGQHKKVIPLLFYEDKDWHSWIDNPMNIAREINYGSDKFKQDICVSLGISLTDSRNKILEEYINSIKVIQKDYCPTDLECIDLVETLSNNHVFCQESPFFRDKMAYFSTGFETFDLLRIIVDSFIASGKYLWIWGRKNAKLFSGTYQYFFDYLSSKSLINKEMNGIDFRCLFLDPESPEVHTAHIYQDIFLSELEASILRMRHVVGTNKTLRQCFRQYSAKRDEIIIRVDNAIVYSVPRLYSDGTPHIITNSNFQVFSAKSELGQHCINKFENIWDTSKRLF